MFSAFEARQACSSQGIPGTKWGLVRPRGLGETLKGERGWNTDLSLSIDLAALRGRSFERRAIQDWLARGNTASPVTGRPLRASDLASNRFSLWNRE